MKIKKLTNRALEELKNIQDYKAEAEWLVALSLKIKRSEVYQEFEVDKKQLKIFNKALKRRKRGEPLAYIFKSANFYGYDFYVNKNVLIPRPETEELVELALKSISPNSTILDIGTGSGAIAIAISKEIGAKVTAVDISLKALEVAKENAKINDANVELLSSDLFENLKGRKFDIIISNPPYISQSEYEELMPEVKIYEPKLALVCEEDGLEIYRKIIEKAPEFLNQNGKIFFEIGYLQAEKVCDMLKDKFKDIKVKKDLQGLDRMVYATLS